MGGKYGLPGALSGHLTYFYWKPAHVVASAVLLIEVSPSSLGGQCASSKRVATIHNSLGLDNEEEGNKLLLCTGPHINLNKFWARQQHMD